MPVTDDTKSTVVPLFAAGNDLAPDFELQAQYLEAVAKEMREKKTAYVRCLLVMQPPVGELGMHMFGGPTSNLEAVGLMNLAKTKFELDFFRVVR